MQFIGGMYNVVVGAGRDDDRMSKRGWRQMKNAGKTFIPFYMSLKDWELFLTGRWGEMLFYKKKSKQ